jgi:uncharacterized repeat protein (TIGR02543 family)
MIRTASVLLLVLMSFAIAVPANAFPAVHTVTFFENASPTDAVTATQMSNSTQQLTLLQDLSPSFSNAGYTFEGWNTTVNGGGTTYADGASYSFSADIGLYAQWLVIPVVHNVTFFENASASDPITSDQAESSPQTLTLLQDLSPSFSNAGYTFEGWNTTENGGGTTYADGASYSFSADIGLYAQWALIPVVHDVTFFENDSASDSIDSIMSESAPTQLTTYSSLQPAFSDPGHSFSGWNTSPDGSGVAYADNSTYSFDADISLYAQWADNVVLHTVTFVENDSVSDAADSTMTDSSTSTLDFFSSLQPTFSNPGHSFSGWNTSANGSGSYYADGAQFSFATNLTLYAQWSSVLSVHTVTFNENDSATDSVNVVMSDNQTANFTRFISLEPAFENGSLSFSDWNSSRDGTGTSYSDGAQFAFTSNLVVYAQWSGVTVGTISFVANGGSGAVTPISGSIGSTITIPNQSGLLRAGFVLTDWNTSANGSGTKYLAGKTMVITESTVLYAQWSGHKLATLFGAVGTFKSGSSSLSASLKSQINRIALTIKSRKYLKVDLFGYTAATGLKSLNISISRDRARNVATYLANRLHQLKVRGVSISSSGQGSIAGQASNEYSRVEVFGV